MSTLESPIWEQDEFDRVERWRQDELERAGFSPRHAASLACRHDIDLHRAIDLLKQGCPEHLAVAILL